jgi:uncharacterized protein (TIGR03086 family)
MTTTTQITAVPSSPLPDDDPRQLFGRGAAVATATIAAVRADQMGRPTPCGELDVRALLGHLVGVVHRAAAIGRGEDAMSVPGTVAHPDDRWTAAWAEALAAVEDTWRDDAALGRIVVLPWATLPGGAALLGYLNEVVVHTWDLAQATGQRPEWDDDVVGAAYNAISHSLPAEGRPELFRKILDRVDPDSLPAGFRSPPFADAVPVGAAARPIDRLVAYTGRRPA